MQTSAAPTGSGGTNQPAGSTNPTTTASAGPVLGASSGDTRAVGGQAQTTLVNSQDSSAVTGPGAGGLRVLNESQSRIQDSGKATAQSGSAVVDTSNETSARQRAPRSTGATTGQSSSQGVTAQNTVVNSSTASVRVAGQNQADVRVTAAQTTTIRDAGDASAVSGPALVNTPPKDTPPSTATVPESGAASSTGLIEQNTIEASLATTSAVGGGNGAPINVEHRYSANVTTGGAARAESAPACAGASCAASVTSPIQNAVNQAVSATAANAAHTLEATASTVQAASGTAEGRGLVAQNNVHTNANVNVDIRGSNFGLIEVIIESITRILNVGTSSVKSGRAWASDVGPAAPAAPPAVGGATSSSSGPLLARSGDAQATGAQVANNVDLKSTTNVQVDGDNRSPINIVVELGARLVSWGMSLVKSGDAQALAPGGAASGAGAVASSGNASGTGLEVQNSVDMSADVGVTINGSNYSNINVIVRFITEIANYGATDVTTGDARAASPAPTESNGTGGGTSTAAQTLASVGQSLAHVGTAQASGLSGVGSQTGHGTSVTSSGQLSARSGGSTAVGFDNQVTIVDVQNATASKPISPDGPNGPVVAMNSASHSITTDAEARASSGLAYVGPKPPPIPEDAPPNSGPGPSSGGNPGGGSVLPPNSGPGFSYDVDELPDYGYTLNTWLVDEGLAYQVVGTGVLQTVEIPPALLPGGSDGGAAPGSLVQVNPWMALPIGPMPPLPDQPGLASATLPSPEAGLPLRPRLSGGRLAFPVGDDAAVSGALVPVDLWSTLPERELPPLPGQQLIGRDGGAKDDVWFRTPSVGRWDLILVFLLYALLAAIAGWRRRTVLLTLAATLLLRGRLFLISLVLRALSIARFW